MELKGSKTEQNLMAAFAGESQARNKYTYFSAIAREAGFEQIGAIFLETAENEREHAKREFDFLKGIVNRAGGEARDDSGRPAILRRARSEVVRIYIWNIAGGKH